MVEPMPMMTAKTKILMPDETTLPKTFSARNAVRPKSPNGTKTKPAKVVSLNSIRVTKSWIAMMKKLSTTISQATKRIAICTKFAMNEVKPNMYCVLYKVTATPPQDGTYHFVGCADDLLLVRVNGETELDGCASWQGAVWPDRAGLKKFVYNDSVGFTPSWGADADFYEGKPFTVSANQKVDIEVIMDEGFAQR